MKLRRSTFIVFGFTLLFGCSRATLLQDLDQKDANEVMVLLAKHGISGTKEVVEKQQETTWKIFISPGDEEKARGLLVANHLPRQKELGLSGVCKEAGLIPTPKTEKCRELLAIKGEVINSLESLPSVVNADVVLNIPEKEDFPDENTPERRPTASVVVEVYDSKDPEALTESKIQEFVANAVTGMDRRDVSVIMSRAQSSIASVVTQDAGGLKPSGKGDEAGITQVPLGDFVSVGGLNMDYRSAKKFKILAILFLVFFVVLSAALIFTLLRMAGIRQKGIVVGGPKPALPEKVAMDRLVEEAGNTEEKAKV